MIPADLSHAFCIMSLSKPDDNWYFDSGASSHMTNNSGNLNSFFDISTNKNILVGNGYCIPVIGYSHSTISYSHPPLALRDVLLAPSIIKNLMSVRKFMMCSF